MTYKQALGYIYSFTDYEVKSTFRYAPENFDLRRVESLLALLGNPHHHFRAIHIGGTKGKGSTAAMLASILQAGGYRAGLFTSPHLHTFRERIRTGNQLISQHEVASLAAELMPLVSQVENLTTFEIITALAFTYFSRRDVEFAVVEVGLGGRLDATNVLHPLASVITSLSYDHTHILGNTLTQIAREKAGIIKPGRPVISAPQEPEALAVLEEVSREKGSALTLIGREWHFRPGQADLEGQWFSVYSPTLEEGATFWIPLLGEHQIVNATVALAALDALRLEIPLARAAISRGLSQVRWPGRMEILSRRPLIVADSAHNADSAAKLVAALRRHLPPFEKFILILGASLDKDIEGILCHLLPHARHIIVTRSRHPRAAEPYWLAEKVRAQGSHAFTAGEVGAALERALALAEEEGFDESLICITGSVFIVGEARELWARRYGSSLPGGEVPERDPELT